MPEFQPLFIHKDPDTGETWYEFDGVIHLISPNSISRAGNSDSIEWYSDYKQLTSYLASYHSAAIPNGGITPARWSNNIDIVARSIGAVAPNPNPFPPFSSTDGEPIIFDDSRSIRLSLTSDQDRSAVSVIASGQSKTIFDTNLDSDFLLKTGVAWQNFPGATNWAAYGSGFINPQFRVFGDMLQFRGLLRRINAVFSYPVSLGVLPVGARPVAGDVLTSALMGDGVDSSLTVVRVNIAKTGDVSISQNVEGGSQSGGVNTFVSFDSIPPVSLAA